MTIRSGMLIVCFLCLASPTRAQQTERPVSQRQATDTEQPTARGASSTLGIVTTIAGVALVGGGVYFALAAHSDADQVNHHQGPWDASAQALEDSGKRNDVIGTTLLVTGSAAVVVGGLFWMFGGSSGERVQASAAPLPGGMSVAFTGRF